MNMEAIMTAYQIIEEALNDERNEMTGEIDDWYFVIKNIEKMFSNRIEEIFIYGVAEPEYIKDFMAITGEVISILADGVSRDVSYDSIFRSIKERIVFLAGGEIRVWLNIYRITRHYGGSEEGGWWYDWTELIEAHNISYDEAETKEKEMREKYGFGEGDISSAFGGYEVKIFVEPTRGHSESRYVPRYE